MVLIALMLNLIALQMDINIFDGIGAGQLVVFMAFWVIAVLGDFKRITK